LVNASADEIFAFVDDHSRLSSHMSKSSWMMGAGRMSVNVDEAKGQAVGSHIRLTGRVLGIRVYLDEVVTRRERPTVKIWRTVGAPRLLVIGTYAMGVHVAPAIGGSRLRVFIDYDLPDGPVTRWLGRLFGGLYARWCVDQMLAGTAEHFQRRLPVAA
jgi:hypothetical protein